MNLLLHHYSFIPCYLYRSFIIVENLTIFNCLRSLVRVGDFLLTRGPRQGSAGQVDLFSLKSDGAGSHFTAYACSECDRELGLDLFHLNLKYLLAHSVDF